MTPVTALYRILPTLNIALIVFMMFSLGPPLKVMKVMLKLSELFNMIFTICSPDGSLWDGLTCNILILILNTMITYVISV